MNDVKYRVRFKPDQKMFEVAALIRTSSPEELRVFPKTSITLEWEVLNRSYEFTVMWHPVTIWDVLDYFKDKRFYCTKCKKIVGWRDVSDDQLWGEYYCDICNENSLWDIEDDIIFYWFKKRESIEAQEDQCIDYIYNLIGK